MGGGEENKNNWEQRWGKKRWNKKEKVDQQPDNCNNFFLGDGSPKKKPILRYLFDADGQTGMKWHLVIQIQEKKNILRSDHF